MTRHIRYLVVGMCAIFTTQCVLESMIENRKLVGTWRKETINEESTTSQVITFTQGGIYSYRFEVVIGIGNGNSYFEKGHYIYTNQGLTLQESKGVISNYKYIIEDSEVKTMRLEGNGTHAGLYYGE